MTTPGVQLLMKRHLDALNRLRRLGKGSVKLSSERAPMRNQVENILSESGLTPEKRAEIYKKILLKAQPVKPGVVPEESKESAATSKLAAALGAVKAALHRFNERVVK